MDRRAFTLSLGALAAVGGGAYLMTQKDGALPGITPAMAADGDVTPAADIVMGDPDAPVTVIEYASYTCPHCADFHVNSGTRSDAVLSPKATVTTSKDSSSNGNDWASA